jgi:(5-formylfuran-3-yl)methyl phosphate synthase
MRLLVSVRSQAEVTAALIGGADIIDAKEPSEGPLGAVTPRVLAGIMLRVPPEVELSVALGDLLRTSQVQHVIGRLPQAQRRSATYLKLGFAGVSLSERAGLLLQAAVAAAREHPLNPRVIAVAYADWDCAESPSPDALAAVASRTGAAGLLIDTYRKDGRTLLDLTVPRRLAVLIQEARAAGLTTAVAGALGPDHLSDLREAAPDIVGFRGAACEGGRFGRVTENRVRLLRRALLRSASGFVQEAILPRGG